MRQDDGVRRSALVTVLFLSALLAIGPGADVANARREFRSSISRIPENVRDRMTGSSWRSGCPVKIQDLRLVRLTHWNFEGNRRWGKVVVHRWFADEMVRVFRRLYEARFKIRKMHLVDRYGADDMRSMKADNTSAFNCRYAVASGPRRWSVHAYGKAIDVNPVENPYILEGRVLPPAGLAFVDRTRIHRGMAIPGGVLVRAFTAAGWGWGGAWSAPDYQHFSASAR
jgi:hypothetical protein